MADWIYRKKLTEYQSPFMQQFVEIKEIAAAEDAWMDSIQKQAEKILDNAFIQDCDTQGIKRYEKMLGVMPDMAESLEERKKAVLMHMNNKPPYTYRTLLKKLEVLYGAGNYEVSGDLNRYMVNVTVHSELRGQKKVLETMLGWFLPLNMVFIAKNEVLRHFIINIPEEMDIVKASLRTQVFFWGCDILNGTRFLDGSVHVDAKRRYDLVLGIRNGIKAYIKETMDTDGVYIKILSCFGVHEKFCVAGTLYGLGSFCFWVYSGSGGLYTGHRLPLKVTVPVRASIVQDIEVSSLGNGTVKVQAEEKTGTALACRVAVNFWQKGRQVQALAVCTEHMVKVQVSEAVGNVTVVYRRNLHYLDGSKTLDGSRLVNAFYGKEEI